MIRSRALWSRWRRSFNGSCRQKGLLGHLGGISGLLWGALWTGVAPAPAPAQQPTRPLPPALATADAPLVLRGVTVLDVRSGRRLRDRTVVIVGTRIQTLDPTGRVRVPRTARVVEARGKVLIPGLWDMHIHNTQYPDANFPLFLANGVTGVRDAGSPVPLAALGQWKREIAQGTRVGPRLIVSGPLIQGPYMPPGAPAPDTTKVVPGRGYQAAQDLYVPLAAARRVVDSLHAAGADMLKIYYPPRDVRLALIAEAKRVGIRFGGHTDGEVSGQEFSDSGATFIDHGTGFWPLICGENAVPDAPFAQFDGLRCAAAVRRLWQNGTWIVPTGDSPSTYERQLYNAWRYYPDSIAYARVWKQIQQHPVIRGDTARLDSLAAALEPTSGGAWEKWMMVFDSTDTRGWLSGKGRGLADSLRKYRIRLPIVLGSDASTWGWWQSTPGFATHGGLALLALAQRRFPGGDLSVYMGSTPLEVLQTATLNPARALQFADSLGTVEAGKLADLVLLDADPLVDMWNTRKIRAVVANGRYYDRAALDSLLQAAHQGAVAARAHGPQP